MLSNDAMQISRPAPHTTWPSLLTEELQAAGVDPTTYLAELMLRAGHTGETAIPRRPLSHEPGAMRVAISVTSPLAVIFATQTRRLPLTIEDDPDNPNAYRMSPSPPPPPMTVSGQPSRKPAWLLGALATHGVGLCFLDVSLDAYAYGGGTLHTFTRPDSTDIERTQLVDAVKPSLHHVPLVASATCARHRSAPTGRHCPMRLGRFRGPRTQLVGANSSPLHLVP
eukprot:jgi/Tetstr1/463074/TSEL_008009.t1